LDRRGELGRHLVGIEGSVGVDSLREVRGREAFARDRLERDLVEVRAQGDGLAGQRTHRRVLHLPPSAHLLDEQLGIEPHGNPAGTQFGGSGEPGYQPAVLRDVVRRDPDRL